MNVLITGAGGFLGRLLAEALLARDGGRLVLLDREKPAGFDDDPRVEALAGDIASPGVLAAAVTSDIDTVFHLAAVVSGEAEANFDLGMRVNVEGSRLLLEACRHAGRRPRVVFTSSVAVFGPNAENIDASTAVDPRTSYGMEKAVAELLLKDYTRRGFVDGVVLRLPTISVRPGRPNKAASSFASGIIREPLAGVEAVCPVPPETRLWLLSPRAAVANLVHAAGIDLPHADQGRVINLPGITVTVAEMVAALERIAGAEVAARVRWERDKNIEAIVTSWPAQWDTREALRLGFENDENFDALVRGYLAGSPPAKA